MEKRPALGKGLSALIPDVPEIRPGGASGEADVDQIFPNEHQPRHHFEDSEVRYGISSPLWDFVFGTFRGLGKRPD